MTRRVLAALLAAAPALAAPQDAPIRLGLEQAIERARAESARLAQLAALRTAAGEALRGARAARLPQLELSAGYTRNSAVPELTLSVPGVGERTIFPNIPDVYRTRAALGLPLYTGGRVEGGIASAREQQSAAGEDVKAGEADLVLETTTSFWSLVTARESERVLAEALAGYEAHLADARNRLELGLAARNELLAVQVERDRAELSRIAAANAAAVAEADLRRLVGLPPAARVEPVVEPASGDAAAPDEVEALVARALAARPELKALRSRAAATDASARVARASGLPQARLEAGYDYASPNTRILPLTDAWKGTWSVGVQLSWAAFDGGRAQAASAQARAQAEALRHQLTDLEARVRLEVASRVLDLATARASRQVAEQGLLAARENLRVSQDRYREGLVASAELLDAETALLRAGLDLTEAEARLRLAAARLERAVGR
jgi:outer membrane protein TolC